MTDKLIDSATQIHYRTCSLCEASCGIEIHHKDGEIIAVKGDKDDPLSEGHICPKGVALQDLHNDPDRLKKPIKRTKDGWQEISWQQAFEEVGENIQSIQRQHGNDAVGLYIGNPTAHNHGALLMLAPLIAALNTKSRFSATSCDQLPHMLACKEMFGHFADFPIPDIDRTQYFLCFGANPLVSNGSVMTSPNFKERLKRLKKRGGKFVVFDPRKTESAEIANEHFFVKPGTDALVLLAMLNVIFREGLVNVSAFADKVEGLDTLEVACQTYTPESVSEFTGVAAEDIERIAKEFAQSEAAAAYGRVGIATSMFSGLNCWLLYVLNIVCGNLDRPGGLMFTLPAIDLVGVSGAVGEKGSFNKWQSRVRGLPEFAGEIPVATMAEEIMTPGEGQIKAMIIHAGNPVLSVPNGKALEEAFDSLDYMVSIDLFLNETSKFANIILPPTGPLEHGHYELGLHSVAVRNTVKYSPPLYPPAEGAMHDWQLLAELTAKIEGKSAVTKALAQSKLSFIKLLKDEGILDLLIKMGPYGKGLTPLSMAFMMKKADGSDSFFGGFLKNIVKLPKRTQRMLKSTAYGGLPQELGSYQGPKLSMKLLRQNPHGIDLGPLQPMLDYRIFTRNGKIKLAPELYLKDLDRLSKDFQSKSEQLDEYPMMLIGRRNIRCNNSWLHNSRRLVKGKERCVLMMSTEDATQKNLKDGQKVMIKTRVGELELPLQVSDSLMPGVVCMPHGWGHKRDGIQISIAQSKPGESMNDITDNGVVDLLTGMAVINGVPAQVYVKESLVNQDKTGLKEEAVA